MSEDESMARQGSVEEADSLATRVRSLVRNGTSRLVERATSEETMKQLLWTGGSIVLSLLIVAAIMMLVGYNPLLAYIALFRGILVQLDRVLFYATPLIFTGLSVAFAFKCGLFNIGPEGQLYIGAMAAAIIGYMVALPIIVHPLACLVVAGLSGFAYGFLPGLLKAYRGAHEVVTTMMLSYIALLFTQWLVTYPLKEPGEQQWIAQTPPLFSTAWLPSLFGSPFLHAGLILAVLAVIAVDFIINHTVLGYEMRAVGLNAEAARTAGIDIRLNTALALGIAGSLAGIGGASEIMGYHHRFRDAWSTGLGWDGITVAVLGRNNPWGVLLGALFFGALRAGGNTMQYQAGVPAEMVSVIQGFIVLFVAAPRIVQWVIKRGGEYSAWVRDARVPGLTHLSMTLWTALSPIIAITVASAAPSIAVQSVLALAAATSVYAFIGMLRRDRRGLKWALIASLLWGGATLASLLEGVPSSLPTLVMAIVGSSIAALGWRVKAEGPHMGD
ncbi:MAG: ABC transporter permease [Candidatus Thorarchaeota archaeon]